jgi:hypothetical protein
LKEKKGVNIRIEGAAADLWITFENRNKEIDAELRSA